MKKVPLFGNRVCSKRFDSITIHKILEYGYGDGKEGGYWVYDHTVLQFEDCKDATQVIFPNYDSVNHEL
jgi:hypothetical protein